ncbi:Uncharacterised protein [Mycobacteroides abscessus subsp. abscessus]|nr:Uncharacterised protein [Mycobacteroides abscessus subsp. abscessus]
MYLFNSVFKRFTWFKSRNFACSDFDFITSLRVAALTCSALADFKVSETDQLYFITIFKCVKNSIKYSVNCFSSVLFRKLASFSNCVN